MFVLFSFSYSCFFFSLIFCFVIKSQLKLCILLVCYPNHEVLKKKKKTKKSAISWCYFYW